MTAFTKDTQTDIGLLVTFIKHWARYQEKWIEAERGSIAEASFASDKHFYAARSYRICVKLGLNPVDTIGTPACQDAYEYDMRRMKEAEANNAA